MKYKTKTLKYGLAGILSLAMAAAPAGTCLPGFLPAQALTVYAGPAEEATVSSDEPTGPAALGQTQGLSASNYYNVRLSDPIVKPVDKYSYEQMDRDIQALKNRYPNQMTVNVIGQSADGRNLYDIIIGNPSASEHILFQGAIHAREYINVPLMMQQLEYLLACQNTGTFEGKSLSEMLGQTAVHFVPLVNPDGISISQSGDGAIRSPELKAQIRACYELDTAEGRTTADYDTYLRRWKSNGRGVDLNHNFDAGWNTLNTVVSKEAEIHAARPTTRPAEISVPVSTIQPPIPRAMGSFAAVREIIFTIEERLMNLGCFTVMKMIAMAMMIYIALFKIRSPIFLCWSFLESALNSCALDVALLSATVHSSYPYANFAARAMISSCVVVLASTSPASCPPDITRIRSQTPKSSGISEETISTVFPSLARLRISW